MARTTAASVRFEKKREMILAAAQDILYRHGVRGMTLAGVAAKVGLNAPGVTYYFKKKEDLAAACFLAGISRLDDIMRQAERQKDAASRLAHVFERFFARHRAVRLGEESQIAPLGEMRTLDEPHRSVVREAFAAMSRRARGLFEGPAFEQHSRKAKTALTHLLLEQIFWSAGWLYRYDIEDYPRVLERTTDIYLNGLGAPGAEWRGETMSLAAAPREVSAEVSREDFFIAATRLINRLGYGGASVDKISAELNVTKGSFYHHNDAKEDLAASCFQRSLDLIKSVQRQALNEAGSSWSRLERAASTLVAFQLSASGPLLRSAVLTALPDPPRGALTDRFNRVVERFAGMVADGAADGSVRPVDQNIAAQMLKVMINAAAEAPDWARGVQQDEMPELYAKPMLMGALARR